MEPNFTAGRCSPRSQPSRASWPRPSSALPASSVLPQGSGRTDAGVHALATSGFLPALCAHSRRQISNARSIAPSLPLFAFIPRKLPANPFTHAIARIGKTYEYRIFRGEICPPFLARYVFALNWPLDIEAMQHAASSVLGEHDFSSFAASDPDLTQRSSPPEEPTNIRTIFESAWSTSSNHDGDLLVYRVRGSGFLHHMVRNLVGTFLEAGRGHIRADAIGDILNARDRSAAGATAPARGLFLVAVDYPTPASPDSHDANLK